jgi:hypothetical protein
VPMLEGDGDVAAEVEDEFPHFDEDEENPLGLQLSAGFVAVQEAPHKKTTLASQAFDTDLHVAAAKRQKSRNNFPKGDSPRPSPKARALETPTMPPAVGGISNSPH